MKGHELCVEALLHGGYGGPGAEVDCVGVVSLLLGTSTAILGCDL